VSLALDEDQELVARSARDLAEQRSPAARVRKLRDAGDGVGFSWELWRELCALGFVGADVGFAELAIVMENLGRELVPEPLLSSVLGTSALVLGQSDALRERWLPRIASGDALVTVAHQEPGARYDISHVETTISATGEIRGEKTGVLDGHVAHGFVVPARNPAGAIELFLVEAGAPGLAVERQRRLDGRGAALLHLGGVRADASTRVGDLATLDASVDRATVALSAELLGLATRAFELTLEYLKTRVQFGVPIGSFQALQHRAARLYIELELAKSAVRAAAARVDAPEDSASGRQSLPRMASLAKARCSGVALHVTTEAIQMHGGIGVTDEHDIGLYLKRARAAELTFGDAAWHRERWARLAGY
jgi:alkylation response protein AidB-like acyl-CoA dehydrogenase